MPTLPPEDLPQPGQGVVLVTLSTGLQLEAEFDGTYWWSHLNENPQAAPLQSEFVVSWSPLG